MQQWCQGKCSLGSYLFHCVSSMPHPQWHERHLAGGDGWGRKPKQLEHTEPSSFPRQREKCFTFVPLYRNNNNKNAAFVTMLFLDVPSPSHIHREMLSLVFIEPFSVCPCFVLPTSQWFRKFAAIWVNNDVIVSMRSRQEAGIQHHRLSWHCFRLCCCHTVINK